MEKISLNSRLVGISGSLGSTITQFAPMDVGSNFWCQFCWMLCQLCRVCLLSNCSGKTEVHTYCHTATPKDTSGSLVVWFHDPSSLKEKVPYHPIGTRDCGQSFLFECCVSCVVFLSPSCSGKTVCTTWLWSVHTHCHTTSPRDTLNLGSGLSKPMRQTVQ